MTPEHKLPEKYVGAPDAELSMADSPGQPATKTPGKSSCRPTDADGKGTADRVIHDERHP